MFFSKIYLLTSLFTSNSNSSTELEVYKPLNLIDFLTTINEGTQMITDLS